MFSSSRNEQAPIHKLSELVGKERSVELVRGNGERESSIFQENDYSYDQNHVETSVMEYDEQVANLMAKTQSDWACTRAERDFRF